MDEDNLLVSTKWLKNHLEAPDIKILDASWYLPKENRKPEIEFDNCHIPGAMFFDIDEVCDLDSDLPHMLPSPEKFASRVKALGIGDGHRVIVYDGDGLFSAARVWWMFRVFGFADISVLDGGLPKWKEEGFQVSNRTKSIQNYHFTARKNSLMISNLKDVLEASLKGTAQIIDARAADRFLGTAPEPRPGLQSGHIPGAINICFSELLNEDRTLKANLDLKNIFDSSGIDLDKAIITSCGSGVTAAILNLALEKLGAKKVSLYDGSWCEWGSKKNLDVEK